MVLTVPKNLLQFEEPMKCHYLLQFEDKWSINIRPEFWLIPLSGFGRKRNQVWKIQFRINRNRKAILNFRFRQCKTELRFWKSGIRFRFPKELSSRTLCRCTAPSAAAWTASGWVAPAPQHLQWCLTIVMIRVRSVMMARTVINIWMTPYTSRVTQSIGCNEYLSSIQSKKPWKQVVWKEPYPRQLV